VGLNPAAHWMDVSDFITYEKEGKIKPNGAHQKKIKK